MAGWAAAGARRPDSLSPLDRKENRPFFALELRRAVPAPLAAVSVPVLAAREVPVLLERGVGTLQSPYHPQAVPPIAPGRSPGHNAFAKMLSLHIQGLVRLNAG